MIIFKVTLSLVKEKEKKKFILEKISIMPVGHYGICLSFHNLNDTNHKNLRYIYERAVWTTFTLKAIILSDIIEGDINNVVCSYYTKYY